MVLRYKPRDVEQGAPEPRPEATPQEARGDNRSVEALLSECRARFDRYRQASTMRDERLFDTLARILELDEFANRNDENKAALEQEFATAKIKKTKATPDFTRLVKLVFNNPDERTNISRYAAVLRLAKSRGIASDNLAAFVKENNGLVACARIEAQGRNLEEGSRSKHSDKRLEELRNAAVRMKIPELAKFAPEGLCTVLIEKASDGTIHILGFKEENETAGRKFSALAEL